MCDNFVDASFRKLILAASQTGMYMYLTQCSNFLVTMLCGNISGMDGRFSQWHVDWLLASHLKAIQIIRSIDSRCTSNGQSALATDCSRSPCLDVDAVYWSVQVFECFASFGRIFCQMLSRWTKQWAHSINVWDIATELLPLYSVYQAPSKMNLVSSFYWGFNRSWIIEACHLFLHESALQARARINDTLK